MKIFSVLNLLIIFSIIFSPFIHAAKGDQTLSFGYISIDSGFLHNIFLKNKVEYDYEIENIPNLLSHNADSEKDPQGAILRQECQK